MRRTLAFCLALLLACSGKLCGATHLAELTKREGEVQRDLARSVGAWRGVLAGARFEMGDGLRTGATGRARLALEPDGVALVEPNTLLRFLDRDPRGGEPGVAVEEGTVELASGQLDLEVHTPRALARIDPGTRVRIVASEREVQLDVLVGRVAIDPADGGTAPRALSAGDRIALFAPPTEPPSPMATRAGDVDAAAPESEEATGAGAGGASRALGEPDQDALSSFTLHVRSVPVALRIPAPPCDGSVSLEVEGRRQQVAPSPPAQLTLRLTRFGAHQVKVRCDDRLIQQTSVRVARDAAAADLPTRPQHVEVEADGRRYTVRYQNLLPSVKLGWDAAKPAGHYTLYLRRGERARSFRSARPERELSAGELSDGSYAFWFESERGERSEVSTLRIEFDNTARSLVLSAPEEGSARADTVQVSGVALLRSAVSANGVRIPLDDKGRFRAAVAPSEDGTILVRAEHPRAGVHYYLRRLR